MAQYKVVYSIEEQRIISVTPYEGALQPEKALDVISDMQAKIDVITDRVGVIASKIDDLKQVNSLATLKNQVETFLNQLISALEGLSSDFGDIKTKVQNNSDIVATKEKVFVATKQEIQEYLESKSVDTTDLENLINRKK